MGLDNQLQTWASGLTSGACYLFKTDKEQYLGYSRRGWYTASKPSGGGSAMPSRISLERCLMCQQRCTLPFQPDMERRPMHRQHHDDHDHGGCFGRWELALWYCEVPI